MKKAFQMGLMFILMLTVAAGCGTSSNSSGENESAPSENTGDEESEASAKQVELEVFMSFPRFKEQFEAYFDQFKTKMKEEKNVDVSIKLEMPKSDQANQILQTRLASNDAPDLFTLHAIADIPTFYEAGYLTDLSDQPFVETLYDDVKKTVTYNDEVVALPLESLAWGYLYNKDIFADLDISPPQTLDEMETVVETLQNNGEKPFLLAFQESWVPQLMMALSLGGVVNSEHPNWVENMNQGEASYEEVSEIFNIIDLVMENGTEKPFEVSSTAGATNFANGEAAMWLQGPWISETLLDANPDMNFGVAPLPVSNDPEGTMINLSTSTSLAVSPTTDNKEIAMDLMNYILNEKDSSELFKTLKFNPVATVHNYETFPWVEEAMSYVSEGKAYQDLQIPGGVTDEQAKLMQSYYTGSVTKEEIIQLLDSAWTDAVKSSQ